MTDTRSTHAEIESTLSSIKKLLLVGGLFATVGYLLILGALALELTQFHPLLESFFREYTQHSLAGGGPERTASGLNQQLATIHKYPSTLLWLKLGGIGHILVGIFLALAAIIRALSLMPVRLGQQLQQTEA